MIIAFEGIDGAGKSTAIHSLEHYLENETAYDVKVVPNLSLADLSPFNFEALDESAVKDRLSPRVLALSRCLEMTHNWERYAVPALKAGYVVLYDRYTLTPRVRDVIRGVEDSYIVSLYSHFPSEDILFYLDIDPKTAFARKSELGIPLGNYEAGMDIYPGREPQEAFMLFQKQCRTRYKKIMPKHAHVIDASKSAFQVFEAVLKIVQASQHKHGKAGSKSK